LSPTRTERYRRPLGTTAGPWEGPQIEKTRKPEAELAVRTAPDDTSVSRRRRKQKKRTPRRAASRRAAPAASYPPEDADDPRAVVIGVKEIGGVPVEEPTNVVVVEPVRLESGETLMFQSPFVVPLYLLKATKLRDRAEPLRHKALHKPVATPDGTLRPRRPTPVFDALEDLALSVFLAAAAIEAYANFAISRLPENAMVELPRRVGGETVYVVREKNGMEWLSLSEKVTLAVPILTGRPSIKGTKAWEAFRKVKRLRNAIVHVRRDVHNDPERPSPFGRLLLGEGSRAPEEAVSVIEALEPGWLPDSVRDMT